MSKNESNSPHYLPRRVRTFSRVDNFLDRAGRWLLSREAEHNLALGICRELQTGNHSYESPIYLASIETDGEVNGAAFRTPPFKLGLTRMPVDVIDELVGSVSATYDSIPAVMGPETQAVVFAEKWARLKGLDFETRMRQRIHAVTHVTLPEVWPEGQFRKAGPGDQSLCQRWALDFIKETGVAMTPPAKLIPRLIESQSLFLWATEAPVSMAATMGPTPNGIRVGLVYTPPEYRGKGFASAGVARLSQSQLASGRRFCFLYTDLGNPTSNSIYARIGYMPVGDVVDVVFV